MEKLHQTKHLVPTIIQNGAHDEKSMIAEDDILATLQLNIPNRSGSTNAQRIHLDGNAVEPALERDRSYVLGLWEQRR